MVKITPTKIFRKGTATQIDIAVSNYELNGNSVALSWQLKDDANNLIDADTEVLGADVVKQWNASDDCLVDALLKELELEKA